MISIDINCDLGECNTPAELEKELEILPLLTSVNICCGFHSGKSEYIEQVVDKAIELGLQIGAHPSYPDRTGFGRRPMEIAPAELKNLLQIQIEKISGLCRTKGGQLSYVKPHGALYNKIMKDDSEAGLLVGLMKEYGGELALMGLPNSVLQRMSEESEVPYVSEGFIDRAYQIDGQLMNRNQAGALIENPQDAVIQAALMARDQLLLIDGKHITMAVDSLCIHGDNPHALPILSAVVTHFSQVGIQMNPFAC